MFSGLQDLPVLGCGVSLSFGMQPDPVALSRAVGGPAFVEYAGPASHVDVLPHIQNLSVPVLFHPSCLNLCGPWPNPPEWLKAVDEHCKAVDTPWLAQDVAVCFAGDTPGYSTSLGYFVPPILSQHGLAEAIARVTEVRRAVDRPLLLEPAPVTYRTGPLSIWTWLQKLAEATDCGLLLDAGHVFSHQLAEGKDSLEPLDLSRVVELHVAGGILQDGLYIDAHDLPILPEVWSLFEHLVANTPNLRAICLECEGGAAHTVLPVLRQLRERAWLLASNEELRRVLRSQLA